jgi:hypothetical protein
MAWLFQARTQWLTRFGVFTTLLGALFIRYGVAIPFSDGVNPEVTHTAISPERLADYYVAVVLAYFGIYVGLWVFDLIWTSRVPARMSTLTSTGLLAAVAGSITLVVLVAWVIVPWSDFINGAYALFPGHTAEAYRQHRVDYGALTTYSSSAFAYLGSFARFALAPVVLWILFFHRRRSRLLNAMFWQLLAILFVVGLFSGQKLPALLLVVGFAIATLIERRRPSILNWRFAAAAIALVGVIAPLLYSFQYPSLGYWSSVQLTVYRLTEEYSRTAQLRFVFYPDLHPFLNGLSSFVMRGIVTLLGIDTSAAQSPEVYIPTNTPGVGANYLGTWNAGYFADAWADFGFIGVGVASVLIGVIVRAIDRWYSSSGQGAVEKGVYTAVCISALYVSEVSTLTALWTYGLGSAFLIYALLRLLSVRQSRVKGVVPLGPAVQGPA